MCGFQQEETYKTFVESNCRYQEYQNRLTALRYPPCIQESTCQDSFEQSLIFLISFSIQAELNNFLFNLRFNSCR